MPNFISHALGKICVQLLLTQPLLYRNYPKYSRAIQKIIKLIVICVNPMIRMLFSTASQWGFPISCTFAQAT